MKLSFGAGIAFLPFGLAISGEYVMASRYAVHLSDVASSVLLPFGSPFSQAGLDWESDDIPRPAVQVLDEDERIDATSSDDSAVELSRGNKTSKPKAKGKKERPTGAARPLPGVHVSAEAVLRIANSGRRPSGKAVTADGKRPAGVQVFGASGLGVGVRDGDVITRVSGVPVTSSNQVIALVIAARGARQRSISALVFRGQRSYVLSVEQPYVTGVIEPPKQDVSPPSDETSERADSEKRR